MYKAVFKRLIDFLLALVAFILISPVFIIVVILLYFSNKGQPFFFQARPGRNEKVFHIIKFKTMNDKRNLEGDLLSDAERLTPVGSFIRKTSLDEIPQLINVIKGDMSLIGPRPLLISYLPYYTETERLRHTVRPGITGLAQVKGRNTVAWDDRLKYDVEYVRNISFFNDVNIIILSIKVVLFSEGVNIDPRSLMKDLDDERRNKDSRL